MGESVESKSQEKVSERVAVYLTPLEVASLKTIAAIDQRSLADLVRLFIVRGMKRWAVESNVVDVEVQSGEGMVERWLRTVPSRNRQIAMFKNRTKQEPPVSIEKLSADQEKAHSTIRVERRGGQHDASDSGI